MKDELNRAGADIGDADLHHSDSDIDNIPLVEVERPDMTELRKVTR